MPDITISVSDGTLEDLWRRADQYDTTAEQVALGLIMQGLYIAMVPAPPTAEDIAKGQALWAEMEQRPARG